MPEQRQDINIETMSSAELGLLLSEQWRTLFQVQQNIAAIENQVRQRMPKVTIETSPEQPLKE